ncbi:hypothetical protein HMPREF9087_2667 [Enterococcus casseliflavus ATCC 12755]|jgi:hypothetical protein|uniref:Uncharacterized protein n=1 Tax=Enterococcus casseliflavus ATCC 12755 TaxID=888066 RepID=F0EME8_ENTCA|nr:hypothetical protein HMPREF9087_2667 [Enterococcus casseliflavus ATCC 12755]EPH60812.1 hypothetical protein D931_03152 [Enterococcus faecium 13.SD.W.09]EPH90062.1 hypothetical protein D922_03045 [Enterococcus faecalis 06-MB-DW-09]
MLRFFLLADQKQLPEFTGDEKSFQHFSHSPSLLLPPDKQTSSDRFLSYFR